MQDDTYVRDISTLRITDAEEAGGKGANMGELVAANLPVPQASSCCGRAIRTRCGPAESMPKSAFFIARR
jgi:phosphoenolpyruvate synthase/pyruvate phosphate dikinase